MLHFKTAETLQTAVFTRQMRTVIRQSDFSIYQKSEKNQIKQILVDFDDSC